MESVNKGFEVQQHGDHKTYLVTGNGLGSGCWSAAIIFAFFTAIPFAIGFGWYGALIPVVPTLIVLTLAQRAGRRTQKFDVFDEFIQVSGKRYSKQEISQLLIRNEAIEKDSARSRTVVVSGGLTGNLSSAGADLGNQMNESINERSYQVAIRYGAKLIPLAGNMTQDQAISLLKELNGTM